MGVPSQAPGIFAGHSRYLRQPGKVCGIFVPAVVRSHPPCVIPVTAQVVWVATQVVWVAFVCLITGVEIHKTGLLLFFFFSRIAPYSIPGSGEPLNVSPLIPTTKLDFH